MSQLLVQRLPRCQDELACLSRSGIIWNVQRYSRAKSDPDVTMTNVGQRQDSESLRGPPLGPVPPSQKHWLRSISAMEEGSLTVAVIHRSASHTLTISSHATLQSLAEQLQILTDVPPHLQKLLYKGKKNVAPTGSLQEAGILDGMKITMLGTPQKAMESLLQAEKEQKRKEEILKAREAKPAPKVRANCGSVHNFDGVS